MRMGLGLPGTRAKAAALAAASAASARCCWDCACSACVGSGQIANLGETARPSIAFESIDGPPAAVVPRLASALKEEAVRNHIAVGAPGEVNYRLHGYFAARSEPADPGATASAMGPATTSMAWTLDLYDGDAHRVVRLSGEEKAGDGLGPRPTSSCSAASPVPAWIRSRHSWRPTARRRRLPPPLPRRGRQPAVAGSTIGRRRPRAFSASSAADRRGRRRRRRRRSMRRRTTCRSRAGVRPLRTRHPARRSPSQPPIPHEIPASAVPLGVALPDGRNPRDKRRARAQSYCQPCRLLVIRAPRARQPARQETSDAAQQRSDQARRRQLQSRARRRHRRLSRDPADQGGGAALRRHGDLRRDPGKRARHRRFRHPVDVVSGQRPPDGIAHHHRRAAPRVGAAHHRGRSPISAMPGRTANPGRARRSRPSSSPT